MTLSTAESERIAVTEGHVAARSVDAFMQEAFAPDPKNIPEGVTLQGSDSIELGPPATFHGARAI